MLVSSQLGIHDVRAAIEELKQFTSNLSLTHHASLRDGPSPCWNWSAWHRANNGSGSDGVIAQTHAHSDAAGFSVINKKWRHEVLAGWPSYSDIQHQSHQLLASCLVSSWFAVGFFVFFTFLGEEDVSVTLAAVCRVRGVPQQVTQKCLISQIPLPHRGGLMNGFKVLLIFKIVGKIKKKIKLVFFFFF